MDHGNMTLEIAQGLKVLRDRIAACKIPPSTLDESLNIATWNIREFGKKERTPAAIHYIAEIISQFDIVAVVELRDLLGDLKRVMDILGPDWRIVYSDYISDDGGNGERIGYLFDRRMVAFTGLAAEADPSRQKNKATDEYLPEITWWRSPYIASFRAGNFDFHCITAHIRWGSGRKSRVKELTLLADWIDLRQKSKAESDKDIILMGDFNIESGADELLEAITSKGLRIPGALTDKPGTDLGKISHYDQILHYPAFSPSTFSNNGGVLDFYCDDHTAFPPFKGLTKQLFTYQLSDHLPLWIQLKTDVEDEKLDQIISARKD
jgi:endonuclease/exonuclease/phosphatase family metal-dependent hydrolase